jgi:hypothetical protein
MSVNPAVRRDVNRAAGSERWSPPAPVEDVDSCAVVTDVIGAEQHACGLGAEGVASHGDAASIKASFDLRDGVLDEIELIQDLLHVVDAGFLERRSAWR